MQLKSLSVTVDTGGLQGSFRARELHTFLAALIRSGKLSLAEALIRYANELPGGRRAVTCILFLAVALLLSCSGAWAQVQGTFYVANWGNDSYSGTSAGSPWHSLAKLNGVKLAPGSSVYLQCGSVFRETLNIGSSGTASAPITYGANGSCNGSNLPVISGANLVTNWTSASDGGFTVYHAYEPNWPSIVFQDNYRLNAAPSVGGMTRGTFYYDSTDQVLYVRTNDDSPAPNHSIEANIRDNALVIEGVSYININGIEVDKANQNNILAWGSLTNINITGTVTNWSYGNGINFSAAPGQAQNNILIKNCTASYNGQSGVVKEEYGNNVVVQGCTANYNAFDSNFIYTAGIRFVSDSSGLYRPTNSGASNNTANFNGVNPDNGVALPSGSAGQQGMGVWCDTCGNGSFLIGNVAHNNAVNGVLLENTGATGSLTMAYNIAYNNGFAGIEHSRSSHNDIIANNTSYNNQYNCYFSGLFGGGDTTIGMVNNIYENNICASKVSTEYGVVMVAEFGAENNNQGQGSGNIYRANSLGPPSEASGRFAIFGSGNVLDSYGALNAAYGRDMEWMEEDPLLVNPAAGNFALQPGSPAIGVGYGHLDLGAVPDTGVIN